MKFRMEINHKPTHKFHIKNCLQVDIYKYGDGVKH